MMICVRQVCFLKKPKVVRVEVFCESDKIWSIIRPIIEIEICQQKNENKCTYFSYTIFRIPSRKKRKYMKIYTP